MMPLTARTLTPSIGIEITGIDLGRPIDDETLAELRHLWLDHVIAVFPGQDLDDEQQIAFSRRIGELELINMAALQVRGQPEVYAATNLDEQGRIMTSDHPVAQVNRDNQRWHSDSSFKRVPAMASALHARIVPEKGGDTEWANMVAAYGALDDRTKEKAEGRIALHDFYWSRREIDETAFTEEERAALPPVRHPLIRVHEETGRPAIYAGSHTREIEGMDWEEGRALIDALIDHATQPCFTYRHSWQVGDLVLWDNRAALHRGIPFDAKLQKRRMHRTTIAGTGPTI